VATAPATGCSRSSRSRSRHCCWNFCSSASDKLRRHPAGPRAKRGAFRDDPEVRKQTASMWSMVQGIGAGRRFPPPWFVETWHCVDGRRGPP
jgi:hypothetical protein